jgi:hypothetical protein
VSGLVLTLAFSKRAPGFRVWNANIKRNA